MQPSMFLIFLNNANVMARLTVIEKWLFSFFLMVFVYFLRQKPKTIYTLLLMLVKTFGSAVYGVEAITITIEVNVSAGQHYTIVGLPDNAVKESLQRMESAIKTNDWYMPRTKIVVNLAPADIKKSGS